MHNCCFVCFTFVCFTLTICLEPLEKTISLRESTKNKILTAEGILLLLCVIVPSASLIFQVRRSHYYDWLSMYHTLIYQLPQTHSIDVEAMVNFQNVSIVVLPFHSCQHTRNYFDCITCSYKFLKWLFSNRNHDALQSRFPVSAELGTCWFN